MADKENPTIEQLQAENEGLRKQLASAPKPAVLEPGIRQRMQAGLTRQEAEECEKAQFENDRALEALPENKKLKKKFSNGEEVAQ